jgi:hypothetical protein|nr:MAG TPA: hypothetical protein [Caudoviricetes sp.]
MYQYPDYLMHYGVLGMKWGVRHAQKKAARKSRREAYRKASSDRDARYRSIKKKFKSQVAGREAALSSNKEKYKRIADQTNEYYNEQIEKHKDKAKEHYDTADFWGRDTYFGKEYISKAEKHESTARGLASARDSALAKNSESFTNSEAKIIAKYADSYEKASAEKKSALKKSGQQYINDRELAKQAYKDAIKRR